MPLGAGSVAATPVVTVAALFTEDFTGSNGAAWNASKWSVATADNSGTVDIQSNAGRMVANGVAYAAARARANMTAVANAEILVSFTLSAATSEIYPLIQLRASDTWDSNSYPVANDGYRVQVQPGDGNFYIIKCVAGTDTSLANTTASTTTFTTAKWWCKFQTTGTTVRCKVWAAAGSEPGSWDLSVTDSSHASGKVALGFYNGADNVSRNVAWDDLVVTAI